jgi:hypothetical protein
MTPIMETVQEGIKAQLESDAYFTDIPIATARDRRIQQWVETVLAKQSIGIVVSTPRLNRQTFAHFNCDLTVWLDVIERNPGSELDWSGTVAENALRCIEDWQPAAGWTRMQAVSIEATQFEGLPGYRVTATTRTVLTK